MQHSLVRDGSSKEYLWDVPVIFQRLPIAGEYIWLDSDTFLVQAVSHTWDGDGVPYAILDVALATSQQGTEPKVSGKPHV